MVTWAHESWTGHAACQWKGQAHALSVMNAKAHVAQRRHARFRPLAYVVCSMPRGSIGFHLSGEQECTRIGPDTCRHRTPTWALIKARVCSVLEPWDPLVGGPDPIRGGGVRIPFQGSGPYTWGSWTKLGGPDCISRGPALSHGGPDSLLMSWSISLSLDTW
jgi:hypothetical protein